MSELSVQDRLDIINLISHYAQTIDGGDLDGYVNNFTPDADIEWENGACHGHAEIRKWVGEMFAGGQVGANPARSRHFVGLPEIREGDSERASVRTYIIMFTLNPEDRVHIPFVGSYDDTVVKVEGKWLFRKRIIGADLGGFRSNRQ